MKIAYFDCQFGAAGDMLLGALIGAGLPIELWLAQLKKIALPQESYKVSIEDVTRCTIASKKVSVLVAHEHAYLAAERISTRVHFHQDPHHANHHHIDEHLHHERSASAVGITTASHDHDSMQARGLSEITQIIDESNISIKAKTLASSIFYRLAQAEGKVHGIPADQVHFHEVGAIDAIIDIVGFAIGYDLLGIEKSIVSPLPLGNGIVKTAHGIFPLPPPAVIALLTESSAPTRQVDYQHECLTPTGAAILTTIADSWGSLPAIEQINATGYGAGDYNPHDFPNVCRLILGESSKDPSTASNNGSMTTRFKTEQVVVLETNLDDLSPQVLSYTCEQLLKLGALDTFITPCLMKKGRSGHLLTVLCEPAKSDELQEYLLLQTSTLGVRKYTTERLSADREWQTIKLDGNQPIRIKIAHDLNGNIIHAQPEYEDCAVYAQVTGLPLQEIFEQALTKFRHK